MGLLGVFSLSWLSLLHVDYIYIIYVYIFLYIYIYTHTPFFLKNILSFRIYALPTLLLIMAIIIWRKSEMASLPSFLFSFFCYIAHSCPFFIVLQLYGYLPDPLYFSSHSSCWSDSSFSEFHCLFLTQPWITWDHWPLKYVWTVQPKDVQKRDPALKYIFQSPT